MKKQLLAIAIGAATAAPMAAMAEAELYGRFDVTFQATESVGQAGETDVTKAGATNANTLAPGNGRFGGNNTGDHWEVRDNKSRLGVRGSQDLDASGLSAIYQLEMQFNATNTGGVNFAHRNTFVGLESDSWGKVFAGAYDSVIKQAEFGVDQFNNTDAEIDLILDQNRYGNTLNYHSPKFGPSLQVKAQLMPGESRSNADQDDVQDGIADGMGISIGMEEGNMYGAIAYETGMTTPNTLANNAGLPGGALPTQDLEVDTIRVSGGLDGEEFGVGFIYDQTETSAIDNGNYDDSRSGWVLSGRFNPTEKVALKLQYGDSDTRLLANGDNDERSLVTTTLGADYMLGKQTKAYAFYSMNEVDGEIAANTDDDSELNVLAFGLQHRF
jgi:predicted porin